MPKHLRPLVCLSFWSWKDCTPWGRSAWQVEEGNWEHTESEAPSTISKKRYWILKKMSLVPIFRLAQGCLLILPQLPEGPGEQLKLPFATWKTHQWLKGLGRYKVAGSSFLAWEHYKGEWNSVCFCYCFYSGRQLSLLKNGRNRNAFSISSWKLPRCLLIRGQHDFAPWPSGFSLALCTEGVTLETDFAGYGMKRTCSNLPPWRVRKAKKKKNLPTNS